MKRTTTKKLNEAFKWSKICRVEPFWEMVYNQDGEEQGEEISHIDLVLDNGERIRISGNAYHSEQGEEPLCTLNISKAEWVDVNK